MSSTAPEVARGERSVAEPPTSLDRMLGHPVAFCATALLLLVLFSWTFVAHPGRTAPTRDPAYYTWRVEALISEEPDTQLEIEGPFGMYSGGYRVTAPVIGGLLRRVGDVADISSVAVMMVTLAVLIPLLLAGFAYRLRRDPLVWHAVALSSAGLMLTPPFVGYLDNLLCMFFLAGALWFLPGARASWRARTGFGLLLLVAGMSHPTTLAIFGLTLATMTAARALMAAFLPSRSGTEREARSAGTRLVSAVRADLSMLLTALAAAVVTFMLWTFGMWGEPASLSEAALVFPYSSDFFFDRLSQWVTAMRPLLNGPLLLVGLIGLLRAGRRWAEDDLALVSLAWFTPLIGTFGFLFGLTYPYYRFFNTTLAWVILTGVGTYFALRWLLDRVRVRGWGWAAAAGVVAIAAILVTNLTTGFELSRWNNPDKGWLTDRKREDLDALRGALASSIDPDRPVVFVIDDRPEEGLAQIWGFTQLTGNTSRYGLPIGQKDRGYVYQGAYENYLRGEPTTVGNDAYDDLSRAALADLEEGLEGSEEEPVTVLASVFNEAGANVDLATGERAPDGAPGEFGGDVWVVNEGRVTANGGDATVPPVERDDPGPAHLLRVLLGLVLMLVPGFLALRWFLPDAGVPGHLAMAPTLAIALNVLTGGAALALARSPLSSGLAAAAVGAAIALGAAGWAASRPARAQARRAAT